MAGFALIGYGLWGRHHARAIAQGGRNSLRAIACASAQTAAQARADFPRLPVFTDAAEAIAQPGVDAVAVVTPNHLHVPIALQALAAGKHVLLEKPMALSDEGLTQLRDAESRSKGCVSVLHQFRLSTLWGGIKACIDDGQIGAPRYANLSLFRFPYRSGSDGWRYRAECVGSWLLEETVHFFDLLLWYFESQGRPLSLSAAAGGGDSPGLQPHFSALLRWPDGAHASLTQTLGGFQNHHVVEVVGSHGSLRGGWSGASDRTPHPRFELWRQRAGSAEAEALPIGPCGEVVELAATYAAIDAAFAARRPLLGTAEAAQATALCLLAQHAAVSGQPQALALAG
jgi:myo-inositol 2-dehydrogenase / D-chiro-inositol 1-dehydrogenase